MSLRLFDAWDKALLECRVAELLRAGTVRIDRAGEEDADATNDIEAAIQRNAAGQRRDAA